MTDFENKELSLGDNVIVARNKFKTTKLVRGVVIGVDIKQAGMIMAKVEFEHAPYEDEKIIKESFRVASWNIHKI